MGSSTQLMSSICQWSRRGWAVMSGIIAGGKRSTPGGPWAWIATPSCQPSSPPLSVTVQMSSHVARGQDDSAPAPTQLEHPLTASLTPLFRPLLPQPQQLKHALAALLGWGQNTGCSICTLLVPILFVFVSVAVILYAVILVDGIGFQVFIHTWLFELFVSYFQPFVWSC